MDLLEAAGLNLRGVLAAERYDALVPPSWRADLLLPGARSVVLLACGGRSLFEAFQRSPEARLRQDPLDTFVRRSVGAWVTSLSAGGARARALFAFETRDGRHADFVALAAACGLGAPSRLGLLVHPRYGPWLSLRALVLTDQALAATPALADFTPCTGCPAPCAQACPGGALQSERFDTIQCGKTRLREPACRVRCAARRACVLGQDEAYTDEAEAHHMLAALSHVAP